MFKRMLEVGPGGYPALWEPGTYFEENNVQYIAVDAAGIACRPISKLWQDREKYEHLPGVVANLSTLPFRDETFDITVMRSVLGEYTLGRLKAKEGKPAVAFDSPSTFDETFGRGIVEAFRTLKPGGELIVSEEDTPVTSGELSERLSAVGFTAINVTPYDYLVFRDYDASRENIHTHNPYSFHRPSNNWLELRSRYWKTEIVQAMYAPDIISCLAQYYPASSYILTAKKEN